MHAERARQVYSIISTFSSVLVLSILTSDRSRSVTSLTLTSHTSRVIGSIQFIRAFLDEDSHPYTPAFASSGFTPMEAIAKFSDTTLPYVVQPSARYHCLDEPY